MHRRFPGHGCFQSFLILTVFVVPRIAAADEPQAPPPVAYFAISSVDAVLDDLDYIADTVNGRKYAGLLRGFLTNLNNLQGIDRHRPLGLVVYAPQTLGGEPRTAVFVPVDDLDALKTTVRLGNLISLEEGDADDRLGLRTQEKTIPVRLAHRYAFLSEDAGVLDGALPNPDLAITESLKGYDAILVLRREGVPPATLETVQSQLQAARETVTAEHSGASEDDQLVREAVQLGFDAASMLLNEIEEVEIGWTISREQHFLAIEATAACRAGGSLQTILKAMAEPASRFAAIADEPAPLTIIAHLALPERVRKLGARAFQFAQSQAESQIPEEAAALRPHVKSTLESLRKTFEAGELDAFVRVVGGPPEHYAAVGGFSLVGAGPVAEAIRSVLPFAQQPSSEVAIEMDAVRVGGVGFHRVAGLEQRPQDKLLYGEDASILVGAGEEGLWFGVGEQTAEEALADVVLPASSRTTQAAPTFLMVRFFLTDWLSLVGEEASEDARKFREAAAKAFPQPEDDRFEFTIAPTDSGVRLRLVFEEGYLRLIGYRIKPE
jgi:hypothetical protein